MIGQSETIRADAEAQILPGNPTLQFGRRRVLAKRSLSKGQAVTVALFLGELCEKNEEGSSHTTWSSEVIAANDVNIKLEKK